MTWLPALLSLSLLVRLHYYCSSAATTDTIAVNQTLEDGDLLLSSAKSYALGFFTPGNSTGKRYVGIWYWKIPERVVVWVANRNNPVNGTSGILSVDLTGNLVIHDRKTNTTVWNTSLSFPADENTKPHSALLQETGNLVLYTASSQILWQSFDYPTNTLIAGLKFGVDMKRGLNLSLTSWKSSDDPGTGEYSMRIEMKGKPQAYLFRESARVWRLGPWNGIRWSGVPEMTPNITPYTFTENGDEVTEEYRIKDPNIYTIVMLNETGTVNKILWQDGKWVGNWYYPNNDDCDSYDRCGPFGICNPYNEPGGFDCRCVTTGFEPESVSDWDRGDGRSGCRRSSPEQCGNGDGFLKLGNVKVPDTETAVLNSEMKGLEECEELCRKNCSCTGYAGNNISDGGVIGCITWHGELRDMREFTKGGQDMYIRVSASELPGQNSKESKGHRRKWVAGVVVGVLVVAALILVAICLTMKRIKTGKREVMIIKNEKIIHSFEEGSSPITMGRYMDGEGTADVLIYDLNIIQAATDNFSLENKLGEGGFGCVYKGKMGNGEVVAVKRLTKSSDQGIEEFKNEVILIARLQHRNLVRLLGYCIEGGEKMLVYEYLPNKGLDTFLFAENSHMTHLDWRKRFEIILGVAQGLLYLHQDSRLRIIHRDLKASNVLLDANMDPKISDFGMARIFGEEQVEDNTNRVVGTYGYMSPEYAMEGHFSAKSDVFSFGILLLEIVTGKKNKHRFNEHSLNLVGDVWNVWNEEKALGVVDPSLKDDEPSYDVGEVLRCIHVGLLCAQPYPDDRPNMSEVVFMLSNETKLPQPNPPGFVFEPPRTDQFWSTSTSAGNQSINCVSITAVKGR
ncbi:unnamed protein product [Cuscuta campestris]|uniref:Receptor-like serine/threonine-protein kinase n=1 Tax=Cuscuta campestris TaxID=132261 RepID=A0A484MHS7_9ASTE|nr:unnamed protein product [Cuscuta campestris]